MGGAVALSIHRKQPDVWNGAVLIAPMCKISEEIKPSPLVSSFLKRLTNIIPTWKTVPTKSILDKGFQCPEKREKNEDWEYRGDIKYKETFIRNIRGVKLFTCTWAPVNVKPKAVICLCHGYAVECSVFMNDTGTRLAEAGYQVYGIDSEGHGKSDGLRAYIPSFDNLVDDSATFFKNISEYGNKPKFLLGESMGGAVALFINKKQPTYWDGVLLVAPMCKIGDDIRPSPIIIPLLKLLVKIIPKWKLVPTKSILDTGTQDPGKREKIRKNPYLYKSWTRLKTGDELLNASMYLEEHLDEVKEPFMVLHGEDDRVVDPSVSKLLYENATSTDKTLKLYPKMWHSLLCGEFDDNSDIVYKDIIEWLGERSLNPKVSTCCPIR